MNAKNTWAVILLTLLGATSARAQQATGIPPLAIRAVRSEANRVAAMPPLKQNVRLTLETNGPKGDVPIQITWMGAGPKLGLQFLAPWPTAANLTHCQNGEIQGTISEVEGGYRLEYLLECDPMTSDGTPAAHGNAGKVTATLRVGFQVQSTVVLKPGVTVTDAASAEMLQPGPAVMLPCPVTLTLTVAGAR